MNSANGSSLPGGLVVSNLMSAWSRAIVSASADRQSGRKQPLDVPDKWGERHRTAADGDPRGNFFSRLPLSFTP